MYRARKIFGATDVLVVSQSFHLPRAIYAARNVGLNAYGVPADIEDLILGIIREKYLLLLRPFKKWSPGRISFLGREISIEGDGRDSLR